MQSYDHINSVMLMLSNNKNMNIDMVYQLLEEYGSYITYPDSIRALVEQTIDLPYRSLSHFTDGAGMIFISGDELKKASKYPISKLQIPFGIECKAAEGATDLNKAFEANKEFFGTIKGKLVKIHLVQDFLSDKFYQTDIAYCYYKMDDKNSSLIGSFDLHNVQVKAGFCKFKNSGEISPMYEYRRVVSLLQSLTSFELYKKLKDKYPDICFDKIENAVSKSYDNDYPGVMQTAKKNIILDKKLKEKINAALETEDESYFENIKSDLVNKGIYSSVKELDEKLSNFLNQITNSHLFEEKSTEYEK